MGSVYVLLERYKSIILVVALQIVLRVRFGKIILVILFYVLLDIFGIQLHVFNMYRLVQSILTGMVLLVLLPIFSVLMDRFGMVLTVLLNLHVLMELILVEDNVCTSLSYVFQIILGMVVSVWQLGLLHLAWIINFIMEVCV